jgi:hypothetical protein
MSRGCFAIGGWHIGRGFGEQATLPAFHQNLRFKQTMDGLAIKHCLPRSQKGETNDGESRSQAQTRPGAAAKDSRIRRE